MSGNIYISPPASTPTILNQDINLNSVLQGQVSYNTDINVFLEDSLGNPITPTGSVLVGNDLTATLGIPNPSGVALVRPNTTQYISYRTGDVGWRTQNGWFNYTPPVYPAKYAALDYNAGAGSFYTLKTPLTVNGVTSTRRFVDASGIQSWSALNNLNLSVIDKLTGLMWTRRTITGSGNQFGWGPTIDSSLTYSATINGITYSDWYVPSMNEISTFIGVFATANWTDPTSSLVIIPFGSTDSFYSAESAPVSDRNIFWSVNISSLIVPAWQYGSSQLNLKMYVHDVKHLIS